MVTPPQGASLPPFEGPEKKLDVYFASIHGDGGSRPLPSMRSLSRSSIERFLTAASCTILSVTTSARCDAYLLSESSLFVFQDRIVIKTCGTTSLLSAMPVLLDLATSVGLKLACVQFSRSASLFPDVQPYPHNNFANEVRYLDEIMAPLGTTGVAFQIGAHSAHAWHLYVADLRICGRGAVVVGDKSGTAHHEGAQSLEIQMFDLDTSVMAEFFSGGTCDVEDAVPTEEEDERRRANGFKTTERTGISTLLPSSMLLDAYDFSPCGYSMNGILEDSNPATDPAYVTIHITPEREASYVSFETSLNTTSLAAMIDSVVTLFKPNRFSAAFVGTEGCAALAESPRSPIAWPKLQKLLCKSFSQVGDATVLNAGPQRIVAVASFSRSNAQSASQPSQGSTLENIDSSDLSPCSVQVAKVAAVVGARIIPYQPSSKHLGDSPTSMYTSGSGDESTSCGDSSDSLFDGDCGIYTPDMVVEEAVSKVMAEASSPLERPLFVIDLGIVEQRVKATRRKLGSKIGLRYAVHCNSDGAILAVMDGLGLEFEAASAAEVGALRSSGVTDSRIAFVSRLVSRRTIEQLGNIRSVAVYPGNVNNAVLDAIAALTVAVEVRVAPGSASDAIAACNQSVARGCRLDGLGLDLTPEARYLPAEKFFSLLMEGVSTIRAVLESLHPDIAKQLSISLGEHYPGIRQSADEVISDGSLANMLASFPRVTVDAGRYIVGPAATLVTTVIGRRRRTKVDMSCADAYNYYLNDGFYGSFSGVLVERGLKLSEPQVIRRKSATADGFSADRKSGVEVVKQEGTLFGPTCDALDRIWTGPLPNMQVGDAIAFSRMGSYSFSASSTFNGFSRHFDTRYIVTKACI
jgi:S-adenosylmethionine decarboxylase